MKPIWWKWNRFDGIETDLAENETDLGNETDLWNCNLFLAIEWNWYRFRGCYLYFAVHQVPWFIPTLCSQRTRVCCFNSTLCYKSLRLGSADSRPPFQKFENKAGKNGPGISADDSVESLLGLEPFGRPRRIGDVDKGSRVPLKVVDYRISTLIVDIRK